MPKRVPNLTPLHKEKRVQFCHEYLEKSFENVFITDESAFYIHRYKAKQWSKSGRPRKPAPKFESGILAWGGISMQCATPLHIIQGTLNSGKYCQLLQETLLPVAEEHYPDGWILQQDGASCHTSKFTRGWLEGQGIPILQWPPNSPDLSPIENIWQVMKDRLEKRGPFSRAVWKDEIVKEWSSINDDLRSVLINSLKRRFELCIEADGDVIKY
jgi:hypothetical protein